MQTKQSKHFPRILFGPHSARVVLCLTGIALLIVAIVLYVGYNPAKESAKPIEAALVQAGAVKKCETGSPGKGPDSSSPWYQASYEVYGDTNATISLLYTVAQKNGHSLTHASLENRGPIKVADAYIDKWYFDNKKQGITFAIYGQGSEAICKDAKIDANHTTLFLSVMQE